MGSTPAQMESSTPAVDSLPLLELDGLRFSYGEREVLKSMSLRVGAGQLVGLLGPNGSGKSTAFAILAGLLKKQGGTISNNGRTLLTADREFRKRLGVVFQTPSLDTRLSCRENLELAATMQGFSSGEAGQRASSWLNRVELSDRSEDIVGDLSGGMRRRLDIARALIGDASLLLMDEPTSGLDERAFRKLWEQLDVMRNEYDLTILVTTHRPEEAERCDYIAILNEGEIVAEGVPDALRRRVAKDVIVVTTETPETVTNTVRTELGLAALSDGQRVFVESDEGHRVVPRLVELFPAGSLQAIELRRPSLGDVFLKVTGRTLGDD
jgi:ABC-2 type transport system ATP-binding protein